MYTILAPLSRGVEGKVKGVVEDTIYIYIASHARACAMREHPVVTKLYTLGRYAVGAAIADAGKIVAPRDIAAKVSTIEPIALLALKVVA
jgi:hypothetical protein